MAAVYFTHGSGDDQVQRGRRWARADGPVPVVATGHGPRPPASALGLIAAAMGKIDGSRRNRPDNQNGEPADLKNFYPADPVPSPTQTRGRKAATLRRPGAKTDDRAKSRRRLAGFPYD